MSGHNAPPLPLSRCQIEPMPQRQFRFLLDGNEKTRWHFSGDVPRPFFYPVNGPSGVSLSRMGHPGAPNHDHHRSFWFAHHDLLGISFWTEQTPARIEQSQWYAIEDGDERSRIAFELIWRDGHDPAPILKQDVFVTFRPQPSLGVGSWSLELQCDFRAEAEGVEFRQSNFGILGLRVAKSLSVVFGEGKITGADGQVGEKSLFGRPNRWIDYSGPVGTDSDGQSIVEGLTLVDHPENPGHGADAWASWHVRDDGWIGPSLSRGGPIGIPSGEALVCRYALLVHAGECGAEAIGRFADRFADAPKLSVRKGSRPHHQWEIAG